MGGGGEEGWKMKESGYVGFCVRASKCLGTSAGCLSSALQRQKYNCNGKLLLDSDPLSIAP